MATLSDSHEEVCECHAQGGKVPEQLGKVTDLIGKWTAFI